MVTFILIRHGYSKFNKEHRFAGQCDIPLDKIGTLQARYTAEYVVNNFKIDKIYSSDLCRAYATAKPIADALGLPVITRTDLREVNVGKWEGMLIADVKKEYPQSFEIYKTKPGLFTFKEGESYQAMLKRAVSALKEIAMENDGKSIVICTHGGVIRALRCYWYNYTPEKIGEIPHVPNASVTVVNFDRNTAEFILTGYNGHLPDKTTEKAVK